jgi:hypothetical protein
VQKQLVAAQIAERTVADARWTGKKLAKEVLEDSEGGQKPPNCAPNCAENCERENGESVARSDGWGGRIRTSEWRNQNPQSRHDTSRHQPTEARK